MEQFLLIFLRKVDRSIDSFIYLSFWIFEWKGFCIDAVLFRIANVIEYLLQFVRENDSLHSPIHFSKFFEREKERKVRFEQCDFGANSDTILTIDRRFANVERQIVFFLASNLIRILLNRISINFSKKNRSIHLSLEGFNFC